MFKFIITLKITVHRNVELIEPQQTALAKLCSYSIYASVELQQNSVVKSDVHQTVNNLDMVRTTHVIDI